MTDLGGRATPGLPAPPGPGDDWLARAGAVSWIRRPREVGRAPRWFPGASLNTCFNALDRHVVNGHGDRVALVCADRDGKVVETCTYARLLQRAAAFAGALRSLGVGAGDPVVLHLTPTTQAVVAMLGCARLGAMHAVVPVTLPAEDLARRLDALRPPVVVSASAAEGGGRALEPRRHLDAALRLARHHPRAVVVHGRGGAAADDPRDVDWDVAMRAGETDPAAAVEVAATDPLFVVPDPGGSSGLVRDNGGHAVAMTWLADRVLRAGGAELWSARAGWATAAGHAALVYAPLLGGLTTVLREDPDEGRPGDPGTVTLLDGPPGPLVPRTGRVVDLPDPGASGDAFLTSYAFTEPVASQPLSGPRPAAPSAGR